MGRVGIFGEVGSVPNEADVTAVHAASYPRLTRLVAVLARLDEEFREGFQIVQFR